MIFVPEQQKMIKNIILFYIKNQNNFLRKIILILISEGSIFGGVYENYIWNFFGIHLKGAMPVQAVLFTDYPRAIFGIL